MTSEDLHPILYEEYYAPVPNAEMLTDLDDLIELMEDSERLHTVGEQD